jgi:glycosyltransferase involved in cell wall biosynthesis
VKQLRRRGRAAPRRLVFFGPSPSEPGGASRRAALITQALAKQGWSVLVIGRSGSGRRLSMRRQGPVTVLEVPGFGRRALGGLSFLVVGIFVGLIAGIRCQGFLALQLSSPATAAALCGLLTRRPFVVLASTSGKLSETSLFRGGHAAWVRRALVRNATALVGQTPAAADELRAVFPSTTTAVVPNPVRIGRPKPLNGSPRVAFAGRFAEEKDLARLLLAWQALVREVPDARLTLIGAGGRYRSVELDLREQVKTTPALRTTVQFTGWIEDPAAEVAKADVFVFPSLSEGMSNALLEACALGRVVVASDIPANVSVLGRDYPLLFAAGDELGMSRALHTAIADPPVRQECLRQITHRVRLFTPSAVAEDLKALLVDACCTRNQ